MKQLDLKFGFPGKTKRFKENKWDKYVIVPNKEGVDSIVEHILVENPDFSNLDTLTKQIEEGTLKFISEIEKFLNIN
jgi:hypothetical protein